MKFSICSWTFGNEPIDKVMRFVAEAGYDAIEIRAAIDEYDWQELSQLAESLHLEIGGLTGDTGWPREETDLANCHPHHRKQAIEHFKRQIEVASEVGATYLVVNPSATGKIVPMGKDGEDVKWAIDSVQQLTEAAERGNVTLVIEPLNRYESCIVNNAQQALQFVQEIGHPNVRTMLNSYHMNIEEQDWESPFLTLKDHLEIVHVADSNRQALGRGHIDFSKFFSGVRQARFDKTIVVECSAPGPHPFQADKGRPSMEAIYTYAIESIPFLKKGLS